MSEGNSPLNHERYAWKREIKPVKSYTGTQTVYIRFGGADLTVRGGYIPGEKPSATSAGQAECFEVHEVYIDSFTDDISEVLGEDRCKEIAEAILRREGVQ